jgi:hypothetical protein
VGKWFSIQANCSRMRLHWMKKCLEI